MDKNNINFNEIDLIEYDVDSYYQDISFELLIKYFIKDVIAKDNKINKEFIYKSNKYILECDIDKNECKINKKVYNPEEFVLLFVNEGEETETIKSITGIDLDNYIKEVHYARGFTERFNKNNDA